MLGACAQSGVRCGMDNAMRMACRSVCGPRRDQARVRAQGEAAAVEGTLDALAECLQRAQGCAVVPGLPASQYQLTLITSVLGGFVAGYASRLQPEGATLTGSQKLSQWKVFSGFVSGLVWRCSFFGCQGFSFWVVLFSRGLVRV